MVSPSSRSLSPAPDGSLLSDPEPLTSPSTASKSLFDLLPRWEFLAAGLLSLLALGLHLHLYWQGQPLWRDEVNLLQLATLPTFHDIWQHLPDDSCPALSHGIVRAWTAVFPPGQDFHLRLLGLMIGVGGLAAMWLSVRALGSRVPLLSIALLGLNPLFIRYGDSVRAYGLGILFALLTLAAIWRLVEKVSAGRIVLAVVVGVLSVHAVFYNAVLLFAVCVSGALMAAGERDWKKSAIILAVGLPAAVSLLLYGAMIHEQHRWSFLLNYPVTAAWLWKRLSEVTGSPDPIGVWLWTLLVLGLAGWAGSHLFRLRASGAPLQPRDRAVLFALLSLVTGLVSYGVFLRVLNYYTQPWYYVVILALAAVCLDVICGGLIDGATTTAARSWRLVRLALVFGFAALTFLQAQQELRVRPTNVDLVAKKLEESAAKDDLIVHLRWECAIPFAYYYHGTASQETTPPLADHRFHCYGLVLQAMATPDVMAPVLTRMADTLQAGHKVWLVGEPIFLREGVTLPPVKPAVQGPDGWHLKADYYTAWQIQACHFLQEHVTAANPVLVPVGERVLHYENLPLAVFQGWKATGSEVPAAAPVAPPGTPSR